MNDLCKAFCLDAVTLSSGLFKQRFDLNLAYVMSLTNDNLLQNFYLEAAIKKEFHGTFRSTSHGNSSAGDDRHWGWESPTCELRGHFLGHWLSAAAKIYAATGNLEVKLKADRIVSELRRCQQKNGHGWLGSFPEKYLTWMAQGQSTWAPQYAIHKTFMGLMDMYLFAGSREALEIAEDFAGWLYRWTDQFSREELDDILDVETGGMLEVWADLYGATRNDTYRVLLERYTRSRLFDPLLTGEDALTNKHANTTIPEIHGAARAYEVTGDERWRRIVEAYWKCAVTDRGTFCTGGQTTGEVWTPPFEFSARLGNKNQEHCTVYNMIRLADFLFRWTGDAHYADYIEQNLYNGILAQQHPKTGMITYFLPLEAGARKLWGSPTYDFWCCHGSLVQAHTVHNAHVYYEDADGIVVCQYIPTELHAERNGVAVTIQQTVSHYVSHGYNSDAGDRRRPTSWNVQLTVTCAQPVAFTLKIRMPWWLNGKAAMTLNGETSAIETGPSAFHAITRTWDNDTISLELPKTLSISPIPDTPEMVAFLDGPVVLAGLCDEERLLIGDKDEPLSMLVPDNEREWGTWLQGYRTHNQERGIRFKPLYEIIDEPYTVYFPVRSPK